jgi:hypothetical protein
MTYTKPQDVTSPREKVSNLQVIFDGGEDELAIATMSYSGNASVGMRWNGNSAQPKGYPTSRNQPVWLVVPNRGHMDSIVQSVGEELAAGRSVPFPTTVESALKFLNERGFKVTLSQ